ncbi:glycosyltransferase [Flavobacterium piscis]|uniref:Glycosyltransferase involved in cell wall biosynthesis n=1 Tax=Flavobacterium piscis TaxID=1114874 RepID=A0ABU1Y562_9FLAO|nr:glycosyltransferase [Flavobacterium piscis]MDR7209367.1 glycosyltransferase involved in cell wall biosynthesis [Flavobacterium piscis]
MIIILTSDICKKISGGTVYNTKLFEFLIAKGHRVTVDVISDINRYDFREDVSYIIDGILIDEKLNAARLKCFKICFLIHLWPSVNGLHVNNNRLIKAEKLICETFIIFVTGLVSLDYMNNVIQPATKTCYLIEPGINSGWKTKDCFNEKPQKIVYLANFIEGKGHVKLVELVKKLGYLDFRVDCFGEILSKSYFLELVNEVECCELENITFNNAVPHEHINELLLEYDLMLHFSDYESYGMGVMEALCAHLPCIITPTGNFKRYQSIGIQGVLNSFDVSEMTGAVEDVLNSPARYLQLVQSVKGVNMQSWETNFELFLSKMEEL